MVYSNKFVMCILVKGRPRKEKKNGNVHLPFGTEYALRLRNKHSRRAMVKLYIDGENVSGEGYVIDANDYVDIKRHHDKDRAFKFVPLDSEEAVDFGKDGDNDDKEKGLIEARFYLEKERRVTRPRPIRNRRKDVHHHHHTTEEHHHHHDVPMPWFSPAGLNRGGPWVGDDRKYTCGGSYNVGATDGTVSSQNLDIPSEINITPPDISCSTAKGDHPTMDNMAQHSYEPSRGFAGSWGDSVPVSDMGAINESEELHDGCTVEGDSTGQRFHTVWFDAEDTYTTLKIFLQGHGEYESEYEEDVPVSKPKKSRKTKKDRELTDLEKENEELRKQLAEMENQKLKEQVEFANKRVEELQNRKPV